eukprot:1157780-Pelagomonas_calceolata.AAC.23
MKQPHALLTRSLRQQLEAFNQATGHVCLMVSESRHHSHLCQASPSICLPHAPCARINAHTLQDRTSWHASKFLASINKTCSDPGLLYQTFGCGPCLPVLCQGGYGHNDTMMTRLDGTDALLASAL